MQEKKNIRVYFIGDSICVGQHVSIHAGWVTLISKRLAELSDELGVNITVSNASANGRTTRQALEALPYEVQSHSPDIVIVQFGMNDCNYWDTDNGVPRVSPQAFKANLIEILERCAASGAKRFFLNTNHPTALHEKILAGGVTYQESNSAYSQLIREVPSELDLEVELNEIESAFKEVIGSDSDKLYDLLLPSPDLLHVSEAGHQLYYEIVSPKVIEAVSRMAKE